MPVARNSNYLLVNFVSADSVSDKDIASLLPIKKQLVWLKSGNTLISDSALDIISQFNNITRLQLDHTNITDKGLGLLRSLTNLQSLNLVGTKVTATGLLALKDLKSLGTIYLYQTNVKKEDWEGLKKIFPGAVIDSGGYVLPFLETDTMVAQHKKYE